MEKQITVTVKVPLASGKEATLTLEDGLVEIKTPVSFGYAKVGLEELGSAVAHLRESHRAVTRRPGE